MKRILLILVILLLPIPLLAFDFTLHKQQGSEAGPTLLIVGGIQGDEPGGFNAAALLATRYQIKKGSLWIVPNLNFHSILERSRGLHGDMNRKFDSLPKTDPEFHQVVRIKKIINDAQVDLVFNLHDGSGFYRMETIDHLHSPDRWGQSCVIDQQELSGHKFGNLAELSEKTIERVNAAALSTQHHFRLKNTKTAAGDDEMQQTLTYYAIRNNKPAFGIEASKSFPTHIRAYYHLLAMEAYMEQAGVDFSRDFPLTPEGIEQALKENILVSFGNGRIKLELNNLRQTLNYFPLPKDASLGFSSNNPLVAILLHRDRYQIYYGNNRLSFLKPQYFDYDDSLEKIDILIDGVEKPIKFGSTVPVDRDFLVRGKKGYRVNVIGFKKPGGGNESDLTIGEQQIIDRFSIDNNGKIFRVEVYRDKRFSGMVLVDFGEKLEKKEPLVSQAALLEKTSRQN